MGLEYRAALKHEESSVCERLERVKLQFVKMLRNLQTQTEVAHREMEEWGGAHFLSEVNSIDQLAAIIRHHIESGSRMTHDLTLACSDLLGLLQSYVCDDEEEEVFEGDEGDVSVDDVLTVVKHRSTRISSQQHTTAQKTEELQQNLVDVFQNLGFKPEEKIPLHLLSQQSVLQELMDSTLYLLADFSRVLEKQSSSVEDPASDITSNTSPRAE
ncbi:uncharacterized protein LOC131343270 [Hemibagrus wyckioides]|uniref:uncharacterized protein LOC131343270 n=1 Tax=Hemibagrus wyckioides TaxID=337641 RepID=UPI00266CD9A7|nr:uncharacterized protein LOC131343270 [Hemibagrus wyckioides]